MTELDKLVIIGIIVLIGKYNQDWRYYEVGEISKN